MKIVYLDNEDSFAHIIRKYFEKASNKLFGNSEVNVYRSNCDLDVICAQQPDLILLGPGPNAPKEAGNYLEAIERFHKEYSIFGICLGFQAIMEYFGQKVVVLEGAVHGRSSPIIHNGQRFFEGIESPVEFARYHSLGIYDVPENFNILACYPDLNEQQIVMAAQHKELPIAGVQFHPESVLSEGNDNGMKLIENVLKYLRNQ